MGKKGISEQWLGPLPDDIINHIESPNGETVQVIFCYFLSHFSLTKWQTKTKVDKIREIYEKVYHANQNNPNIEEVEDHMKTLTDRFVVKDDAFQVDGRF